jgi:hypothetical protein
MPEIDLAIKQLEETVLPWQNQRHGAPSRQLREAAEAHPLRAAESFLRRGPRPGAPGAGGGGSTSDAAWQGEALLAWAKARGRLIDPGLEDRLVNIGGVEHDVFYNQQTGRWIKITRPGKGGKQIQARHAHPGVRATLATEDASLAAYLRRLMLANTRLGDDFWLHGVVDTRTGPRIVISQRHVGGEPATVLEIANHFVTEGFLRVNAKTFYHPRENLLVSDAHRANVFKTPMGIVPFDVGVQEPEGHLLLAVRPSPSLSFEDAVQSKLEF